MCSGNKRKCNRNGPIHNSRVIRNKDMRNRNRKVRRQSRHL